jgi:transcriptional regulator with XRE-family HTH domain
MLHSMNARQCKMARDGLGLTGRDLATLAGVPYATLARFEAGSSIRADTVAKLADTLAAKGAQFIYGADRYGVTVPSD